MNHPNRNRDRTLDTCVDSLQKASNNPVAFRTHTTKENLTHNERRALKQLQYNNNIVIKEADKGGAICIMDSDFCAEIITTMLSDPVTYIEVKTDQISKVMNKIKALIGKHKTNFTDKEIDYLINFEIKCSNLYGLPKVHKSNQIKEAIKKCNSEYVDIKSSNDLTFRPIVAGPACSTSRLSEVIDILIKPLQEMTTSSIRDDIDFLSKIPRVIKNTQTSMLVTFDVESL